MGGGIYVLCKIDFILNNSHSYLKRVFFFLINYQNIYNEFLSNPSVKGSPYKYQMRIRLTTSLVNHRAVLGGVKCTV